MKQDKTSNDSSYHLKLRIRGKLKVNNEKNCLRLAATTMIFFNVQCVQRKNNRKEKEKEDIFFIVQECVRVAGILEIHN